MNKGKNWHGRWNRYKFTENGVKLKQCNGPMHGEEGVWLPLSQFWFFKTGKHKGKPSNYCIPCDKASRGRDPQLSGYMKISEVRWIFTELQSRLGKTETLRRCQLGTGFWSRIDKQKFMKRATVHRALLVLIDVRQNAIVRHRHSIRRGSAVRGEPERVPVDQRDLYHPTGDNGLEIRNKYRRNNAEKERASERRRRAAKKAANG